MRSHPARWRRRGNPHGIMPQDANTIRVTQDCSKLGATMSVPSKALCTKTPGTHLPENPIFLSSSSDADTEQVTAGNKGDVEGQKKSSPRSINFSCPQGSCLVTVSPRDKHLLFAEGKEETPEKREKLQAKMFQTRFATRSLCRVETHRLRRESRWRIDAHSPRGRK